MLPKANILSPSGAYVSSGTTGKNQLKLNTIQEDYYYYD
jgi:hypothetical protein